MAGGAGARRAEARCDAPPKGQCLKCTYPLDADRNVLNIVQRFHDMLRHGGFIPGRLEMEGTLPDPMTISVTIRQAPQAEAKPAAEENPPAPHRRPTVGTSSCCSTNSLCKTHACSHRTGNKARSGEMSNPPPEQTEGAQFAGEQQGGRQPQAANAQQPQQKLDAEQSGLHRLHGAAAASMPMVAHLQHLNTQKPHGSDRPGRWEGQAGQVGQVLGILNSGVADAHNDKSKKSNVEERQAHHDPNLVPAQQTRLQWGHGADRLGGPSELPFQRGMQGRGYAIPGHAAHRGLHPAQAHHGMQQSGDGLGLAGDLQMMEQSADGYGQMLTDEHMHGNSGAITPVQRRMQIPAGDQWAMAGNERENEANRDEARPGASLNRRIDYSGVGDVRPGQSPPSKRARIAQQGGTGNTHGMMTTSGPAASATVGGIDLQSGALVSSGAVGLQGGAIGNTGIVNHASEQYPCDHCEKSFQSATEMQKHNIKEHRTPATRDENGRFPCSITDCSLSFVRRHVMERHVRTVHLKIRDFACEDCGRKFADSSTREVHRSAVHEKKKPWTCNICQSTFTQSSSLGKHRRRFHGKRKENAAPAQSTVA